MFDFDSLNFLPILVVTVIGFMLGGAWYGPLFGEAWLKAVGLNKEDIKPSPMPFVISFISGLATAIVLAMLIKLTGIDSIGDGIMLGFYVGVGFIAAAMASDYAFCGWKLRLFQIQAGYRLTYTVIMGAILAIWQ